MKRKKRIEIYLISAEYFAVRNGDKLALEGKPLFWDWDSFGMCWILNDFTKTGNLNNLWELYT